MDLNRQLYWSHDLKCYETRLWKSLSVAIVIHLVLAGWLLSQPQPPVPHLPDWMQVKLVAGLEMAERKVPPVKQTSEPLTRQTKKPAPKQSETTSTPKSTQAQDSIKSRKQPQLMDNPKPIYPAAAKRRGMQGTVLLKLNVSSRGKVSDVQLEKSSGYRVLDIAAINGVQQWQFIPAKEDEEEIASVVVIPVRFELQEL